MKPSALPYLCIVWQLLSYVHAGNFSYGDFLSPTIRYAKSLELNSSITRTYVPASAKTQIASFLANYTTTTYSLSAATSDASNPYGQQAYKQLWNGINNISIPQINATVAPTPVPSSSLIYPPSVPMVGHSACAINGTLGKDFVWGVASSAQQIEGAIQADGSGPSLLDSIFHLLGTNNSDIATLNYYLYKEDIARLAAAGVQSYSFSIKWARVVPFGKAGSPINQQAIAHYSDLIDTCRQYGLEPIVTLTHFDTPQGVQNASRILADKLYGIFNAGYDQDTFVEDYLYYAKYIVATFGDRVKTFFTFNEPQGVAANVLGARNVQLAHAQLYNFYHEVVKGEALFSYKQTINFAIPVNSSDAGDIAAADRQNQFSYGLFSNAPFLGQQLPEAALAAVNSSKDAPPFTPAELALINGTLDFFAVDIYSSQLVTPPAEGINACANNKTNPLWPICVNASSTDYRSGYLLNGVGQPVPSLFGGDASNGLANTPELLRLQLKYISQIYRPAGGIMITELGRASNQADDTPFLTAITDNVQANFLRDYYKAILHSKVIDKINIRGVLTWAATDNWEFGDYKQRFGLQYVDYNSVNKTRTYKTSMFSMLDFFERFAI